MNLPVVLDEARELWSRTRTVRATTGNGTRYHAQAYRLAPVSALIGSGWRMSVHPVSCPMGRWLCGRPGAAPAHSHFSALIPLTTLHSLASFLLSLFLSLSLLATHGVSRSQLLRAGDVFIAVFMDLPMPVPVMIASDVLASTRAANSVHHVGAFPLVRSS